VPSVEELRASRPTEPGFARALLIAAAVLWLPVAGNVYYYSGGGLVVVALVLVVFGAFGAVKGRQAGRIMTTVALGVTFFFMAPYCWAGFDDDSAPYGAAYAFMDIVAVLLSVAALTQLFHPNTNRYVRMVTVAMRG
jgi:hypothetical protein